MYVFDNSPLSHLFKNYYRGRFPTLWQHFDELVSEKAIVSTREVRRELEDFSSPGLEEWLDDNRSIFETPTVEEAHFVARIFANPHFQQNIERQKLLRGGKNADPFVIARAAIENRTVVTLEGRRPNAVKIPNICDYFDVDCIDLEEFMEREEWSF